jgi:hypothetical protein
VRFGTCVGDGVSASWGSVQVGFASWGGLVRVVTLGWSSWGVRVGVCRSSVVNSWFPFLDGLSLPRQGEPTRGGDSQIS